MFRKFAYSTALLAGAMPALALAQDDLRTPVAAQQREASQRMLVERETLVRNAIRSAQERSVGQPADSAAARSLEQAQQLLKRLVQPKEQAAIDAKANAMEKAAFLGVATSPASVVLRRQLKISEGIGLVVDYVEPNSPAAVAGLEPFDIAVKLNDQMLINPQQLAVLVRTFDGGDEVKLTVLREGKPIEIKVKLIERAAKPIERVLFGMMPDNVRPLEPGDEVRVTILDLEGPGKPAVKQMVVGEAGEIHLPHLNRPLRAAGLSQLALEQSIVVAYRADGILDHATVSVERSNPPGAQFVAQPLRTIQENDTVMLTMHNVEGPGIATVKQTRVGAAGTMRLPRLIKPISVTGCTPEQVEKSVLDLYRSAGLAVGGTVDVSVSTPSVTPAGDASKKQ